MRAVVLGRARREAPLLDIEAILTAGRFSLDVQTLSAARGGLQAYMAPDFDDGFAIVADPEPRGGWRAVPAEARADLRRHRLRFLVGHEVAHSFFYDRTPGAVADRRVPDSPQQEAFCDVFASALLLPPSVVARARPTPDAILDLQRRYDVSLQLTVRAFAEQHPGYALALLRLAPAGDELLVQWASGIESCPVGWWREPGVQSLRESMSRRVLVRSQDRGSSEFCARWLAQRRQALLVSAGVA